MGEVTEEVFAILAKLPEQQAKILHQLRLDVLKLAPAAQDRISYQMPTLEMHPFCPTYLRARSFGWALMGIPPPRRLAYGPMLPLR